jgi:hypothetical protein
LEIWPLVRRILERVVRCAVWKANDKTSVRLGDAIQLLHHRQRIIDMFEDMAHEETIDTVVVNGHRRYVALSHEP